MELVIKEVRTRKDLKKFVLFPFSLYKKDPNWVPPMIKGELRELTPCKNPAFEHCEVKLLLAYRNGCIAGRIAGIINHLYNSCLNEKIARFCWLDFTNDHEVSEALLLAIEEWALAKGMDRIMGPMGFTTFERQGILVEGFDKVPTIASSYNYEYYRDHLEYNGYMKDHDYVEYLIKVPDHLPEKSDHLAGVVEKRYKLSPLLAVSKKELLKYSGQVFEVINAAYKPLHGFVPLTSRQVKYFIHKFYTVVKPELITIVKDANDKVVGFQIAIPSLSRAFQKAKGKMFPFGFLHIARAINKPEKIDLMLVGVVPEFQNKGVGAFFYNEITRSCIQHQIHFGESNGMLEENFKVQSFIKYYDSTYQKRRRLFCKDLNHREAAISYKPQASSRKLEA